MAREVRSQNVGHPCALNDIDVKASPQVVSKEMELVSKNSERIILVTGATGQQGGAVYQHLQKKGYKLRALVRDPNSNKARRLMGRGGEVFQASLDDPDSLMRAMDGVYGVFSVQPYMANEIQQGVAVIESAKRQGASHFVYTSVGWANEETGIPHFESKAKVEEHLRSSGLRYTILRPVFFMENWLRMFGYWGEPIRNGQLRQPLSPTKNLQMVAIVAITVLNGPHAALLRIGAAYRITADSMASTPNR
ncbi:MAG TPA: NmrA/HSCARG family protein [Chthoniobacterales bacterium]|nr:NmrA/HSCARG family protein [Chthoniobacterales bacterium]